MSFELYKPIDTVNKYISFEVSMAVIVKIMVFCVVTPCTIVSRC